MNSGEKIFGRLLGRSSAQALETPASPSAPGLHLRLDQQGHVLDISRALQQQLARHLGTHPQLLLRDLLCLPGALSIEGTPADWQRHSMDLDFQGAGDSILHTRGWIEPDADGWLLRLTDISDLLTGRQLAQQREQNHQLASQMSEQLRVCSLTRLPQVFSEHLRSLAQRWRIPCVAMVLLDQQDQDWLVYCS